MPKETNTKMNREQLNMALSNLGVDVIVTKTKRHKLSKNLPLALLRSELQRLQHHAKTPPPPGLLQLVISTPAFWKEIASVIQPHARSLQVVLNVLLVSRETKNVCWASVFQGLADVYIRKSWCEKQLLLHTKKITESPSYTVEPAGFGEHCYLVGLIQLRDIHTLLCERHNTTTHIQQAIERMAPALNGMKKEKLQMAALRKQQMEKTHKERVDKRERDLVHTLRTEHGFSEKTQMQGMLFTRYLLAPASEKMKLREVAQEIAFHRYLHEYTNYNDIVHYSQPFPGFHEHLRNCFRQKIEQDGGLPAVWPWCTTASLPSSTSSNRNLLHELAFIN